MVRSVRISLIALGTVAVVTATAWVIAASWYQDDGCAIEQWQCSVGSFGFLQFLLGLPSAVVASAWVVVAFLASPRPDRVERPGDRAALATGALAGLMLLAGAWVAFLLAEAA